MNIPVYSADLIKQLDDMYPERIPHPNNSPELIMYKAGARNLVRNLMASLEQQEQEALEKELKT